MWYLRTPRLSNAFFKGRFLVHLFYYIAYNMSLFFRTYIGRLSAIYAFSWNWIWATTTWRTSNPKHLRVTRDCKLWRYRITKLPPCLPTSSPLSSTWKASIWATITSKPSSETLLKTWATPWNRWMLIIIAWEHCVRKFFFRWLTSSRCRWVNIYVNFCLQNGEVVRITEVMPSSSSWWSDHLFSWHLGRKRQQQKCHLEKKSYKVTFSLLIGTKFVDHSALCFTFWGRNDFQD